MFSLENSFIRILFAVIIQIVCLVTAIFGIVCAGEHGKWAGSIRFLSKLAISFAWLVLGTVIWPRFSFCHSLSGLAVYTTWGTLGIVPFVFSLLKVQQKENPSNRYDGIWGTITVLLFCGALAVLLYYQCVTNGRLIADKLFLEESLNAICFFLTFPVILFFYSDICTFSTYIGGTAGKVVRSSQKLAAAGSWPGWFYNIYRNRTSAVGKNSFWTRRQHIFNICGSSLLGDIYVCTIWFYVMAW